MENAKADFRRRVPLASRVQPGVNRIHALALASQMAFAAACGSHGTPLSRGFSKSWPLPWVGAGWMLHGYNAGQLTEAM
jgi:hypothetical protein